MNERSPSWIDIPHEEEEEMERGAGSGMLLSRAELLTSPAWHTALAQFARATGLTVTLYDTEGRICAGPFASTPLASCLTEAGCWKVDAGLCLATDIEAIHDCVESGVITHTTGLSVLALFAIPVRLGEATIGAVAAGWVFDTFPDPISTDRLAKMIGISFPDLWQVVRQQPPASHEKLGTYAELLQTLCDLFIRERAETLQEQEHTRGLRALYQSAQRLAAATSIEAIGESVVEAVRTIARVQSVRLLVADGEGVWRVVASHGFNDEISGSRLASYPRQITSTLRVPVEAADGSLLGIIETTDSHRFTERKRRTQISALGAQAAVAIHKTKLLTDLQREHEQVVRANRVKDEFLATLSHELRTPLTPILSWSMILRETEPEDRELFEAGLEAIERNAKQELHLVDEMLDLTRILNDKIILTLDSINPAEALASAFDLAQSLAAQRTVSLLLEISQDLPKITADAKRLQQILANLVSNAIKFTPDGGQITIGARHAGEAVELFVRDTGIGIAPDVLPQIFDRFHQADSSMTRKHGGLGIGLSVVRGLVELHGGKVWAESEGEGYGSTFFVRLPSATARTVEIAPVERGIRAQGYDGESGRARAGGNVLIVDDAIDTLISLKMLVERAGYTVETANSVPTAIDTAQKFRPDVIVSDLGMPDQDGFDLLRLVRNDPTFSSVPVVALTGFATMDDRESALEAGFAAHLPKPVELSVLLGVLDMILDGKGK